MLKISKITLLFLGLSLVFFSCKDDDEKKELKNQVEVDGKTFDFSRVYIISEQITNNNEVVVGSAHWVYFAGGDLEMADNRFISGEGPFLAMYLLSDHDTDLIPGKYQMEYFFPAFGNVYRFNLYDNFSLGIEDDAVVEIFDAWYSGDTEGTVTVTKSGDKFTFEINLDEYYYMGDSDNEVEEEVTEKVTGNFSGELEVLTVDEVPARMSSMLRKTTRKKE